MDADGGARGRARLTARPARCYEQSMAEPASPAARPAGEALAGAARLDAAARALAATLDHTLLKATATYAELDQLCDEARGFGFAAVCVNSGLVARARRLLDRGAAGGVKVCAVVGFPLGAMGSAAKAFEARQAVAEGAEEIDVVIDLGALRSGDPARAEDDLAQVVAAARPARVKAILEMGALSADEKVVAIELARRAGAAFVKTSTGFGPGGATVEDVALMRRLAGPGMEVKASGGIKSRAQALALLAAGASRLGASSSVALVTAAAGAA